MPHLGVGNQPSYAWCKRPGCPVRVNRTAVGATGGSSKCGRLNVMEWLQPRENRAVEVALQRLFLARQTCLVLGEADALREEASKCTAGVSRGKGPSTYTRIAEIMLGRAYFQQGRAATCKDS